MYIAEYGTRLLRQQQLAHQPPGAQGRRQGRCGRGRDHARQRRRRTCPAAGGRRRGRRLGLLAAIAIRRAAPPSSDPAAHRERERRTDDEARATTAVALVLRCWSPAPSACCRRPRRPTRRWCSCGAGPTASATRASPRASSAFTQLGLETGKFTTIVTENPADLNATMLEQVDAIAWISTTGKPPFTQQQRDDIIRFAALRRRDAGVPRGGGLQLRLAGVRGADRRAVRLASRRTPAPARRACIIERPDHPILRAGRARKSFKLDDEYYRWRGAQGLPGISLPRNLPGTQRAAVAGRDAPSAATSRRAPRPTSTTSRSRGPRRSAAAGASTTTTWATASRPGRTPEFRTSLVKGVELGDGEAPRTRVLQRRQAAAQRASSRPYCSAATPRSSASRAAMPSDPGAHRLHLADQRPHASA